MLELISPPYLNLSPKLLEQRKRKLPPPQIKTYVSAHTQRFCALDINKQNKLSSLASWKKKMHTHTHHQPDIHQAISQLHKIKRSSFCPFPPPRSLSVQESCLQFSVMRSALGAQEGKVFGKQKEPVQQASVSLCACEVDIGISCLASPLGFIWSAGWGIVVCTIARSAGEG